MRIIQGTLAALLVLCLLFGLSMTAQADSALFLPEGLRVVEEEAFDGVRTIREIILPESIERIESRAFANTGVTEIAFPDDIVYIADNAFAGTPLETVYAQPNTVGYQWGVMHGFFQAPFSITSQPETVHVSEGETAVFTVAASEEGLTYQWQSSMDGEAWYDEAGAVFPSVSVYVTPNNRNSLWRCLISNASGLTLASDTARLGKPITKLTWAQIGFGGGPIDNDMVLEALNEISREKLDVEVIIDYLSSDQISMAIQSGQLYDMYFSTSWYNNFDENVVNGNYADISDALAADAPELYATMPENVWTLAKSDDGRLYGIPVKKDYAPMYFVVYDAEFAAQNGIVIPDSIQDLSELTPYLTALKAAMDEDPSLGQYPIMTAPGNLDADFDYINRAAMIGVSYGSTQIHSLLEEESVLDRFRTMRAWNNLGLVSPDAASTYEIEPRTRPLRFVQAWTGYDYSPTYGYTAGMTKFAGPYLSEGGVKGGMIGFSSSLEDDPERLALALKYQELVNTDQEYRDILAYGVPGYHFDYRDVADEEGKVLGQVVIRTKEGLSNYSPMQFAQGSYEVRTIETTEANLNGNYPAPVLDQWEQYFEDVDKPSTPVSALGGFTFDSEQVQEEIAQISAVKENYLPRLQFGTADTDATILEMHQQMNAAGLQRVINEAQRQLDAYLANK